MPKKKKKHAGGRPKGGKPLHEDCCSVKERSPEDSCTPCKNYASYRASKCRYVLGQRKDSDKENGTCSNRNGCGLRRFDPGEPGC